MLVTYLAVSRNWPTVCAVEGSDAVQTRPKQSLRKEADQEERNCNAVVKMCGFTCITAKPHGNLSLPPNNGLKNKSN